MIKIEERQSKKAVGNTSLFVSFPYNQMIVEQVKSAENANYNASTKEWELPISKLAYLIDNLTLLDDITLTLIEEVDKHKTTQVIEHKIKPFDYQSEDIDWIINRNSGLILNEPGLGKTLEVIYAAEELEKQKGIKHCLIICCINTLKQNWKKEINKFSTKSCRIIGERINKKGVTSYASVADRAEELYQPIDEFFVIVNIETLRDSTVLAAIQNSKNSYDMIVVDEVHKATIGSQQGKNLSKLAKVGQYHFGLTGTLLINSPFDAYLGLKFIGQEKTSFSSFKQYYGRFAIKFGHQELMGYQNISTLKDLLEECSIRRCKDLLHLPPRVIVPEYLEMEPEQQKFYNDLQNGVVEEADRVNIKNTSLLGMVTRLRQAATCPSVLSSTVTKNVKIERCCELVDEILSSGHKVIIFSTFKEPLYQLQELLKKYNPLLCTGDLDDAYISESIDKFQNKDDCKIILCTSSKLGTGVTLTAAEYEIFLDSSWTYAAEDQAESRAVRIGTTKSVTIYKLIAKGTIDERIMEILNSKKGVSDYIIDDNYNQTDELKKLLGINTYQGF